MKHLFFALYLWFGAASSLNAQYLTFHNEIETRAFEALNLEALSLEQKIDFLLGVSPNSNELTVNYVQNRVKALLEKFPKNTTPKSYKKLGKKLFKEVHEKFFQQYILNPSFNQIFEEGIYNCATASALYAVLLEELAIPYVIKATTTHVFIIIDADNEPIMLESTDPVNGLVKINKGAYVKMLKNMKIISEEDATNYSNDELYLLYADQDEERISFKELVGVLYMNSAIKAYEEQNFEVGARLIQKGIVLRPTEMNKRLRVMGLCALLVDVNYEDTATLYPIVELLDYDLFKSQLISSALGAFRQHCTKYLRDEYNPEKYYLLYNYWMRNLDSEKDKDLYNEIKFYHHFSQAITPIYRDEKNRTTKRALVQLDSAHYFKPNDRELVNLIVEGVLDLVYDFQESPLELQKEIADYQLKYPYIKDHSRLYGFQLESWSHLVTSSFWSDDETKGFEAYQKFMAFLDKKTLDREETQSTIGFVYGSISSYYVRKKEEKIAKKWLIDGLKLAPKSEVLNRKMETFEAYELLYKD